MSSHEDLVVERASCEVPCCLAACPFAKANHDRQASAGRDNSWAKCPRIKLAYLEVRMGNARQRRVAFR